MSRTDTPSRRFETGYIKFCHKHTLSKFEVLINIILTITLWGVFLSASHAAGYWKLDNSTQYYKIPWSRTGYIFPSKNHARYQACNEWIQGAIAAGYTGPFYNTFLDDSPYRSCIGYYRYPSIKRGPFYPNAYQSTADPLQCKAYETFNEVSGTCVVSSTIATLAKVEKNLGYCPKENGNKNTGPFPLVRNPVHVGTGNKFQQEIDFSSINSGGISFTRNYNSLDERASRFGEKWRHNYDRRVVLSTDGSLASVIRSDGKSYKYALSGSIWTTDPDI